MPKIIKKLTYYMDLKLLKQYMKNKTILDIGGPTGWLIDTYKDEKIYYFNIQKLMENFLQFTNEDKNIFFGDITNEKDLFKIKDIDFEVFLSSHVLEHIANPIKVIKNIYGKLATNGLIITVVPNKKYCWDKDREDTTFEHILNDYHNTTSEDDMCHAQESSCIINGLNGWGARPNYYKEIENNNENRIIHHHVFNIETLINVHEYSNFKTLNCQYLTEDPLHLVYVGEK